MKQNNITIINSQEVLGKSFSVYGDIDNPLFLAKDVANMIEHSDVSKMVKAVDEDEKVKNNVPTLGGSQEVWFLTEYGLYEVLMQSRKPIAKEFKKEVKAILKQLRQSGVVITESATQEAIDFESKYGVRRIRKTFRETASIVDTWNEFKALSKIERDARRINNDTRIKGCSIIIDELQDYLANNVANMKAYEVIMYQEIIQEIAAEKQRLSNKYYGGLLSAQTKQIKKLEEQIEELNEDDDEYFFIDVHPFSENYMYGFSDNRKVKSAAYHRWINKLHLEQYLPQEYPNVDFTQPIKITLLYGHREGMDTQNFGKSIIDQVAKFYNFNDSLVHECTQSLHNYVESYNDGYIYIAIENM